MLVFGFAAFGAAIAVGMAFFFLVDIVSRGRTPDPKSQTKITPNPGKTRQESDSPEDVYGAEFSVEAKSRFKLSGEYMNRSEEYLQNASNKVNAENDTVSACNELNKSYKAVQDSVSALNPVQDEIEKKRGREAYSSLLRRAVSAQDEIRELFQKHCEGSGDADLGSDFTPDQSLSKNTYLSDNLNAADVLFKSGSDGCPTVALAIMAANSPDLYGNTSASQRSELKSYAERCGLRF